MKAEFENTLNFDKSAIGIPFMIQETPIGVIIEVNEKTFICEIWDRYCGYEFFNFGKPISFYLSDKEQMSNEEKDKLMIEVTKDPILGRVLCERWGYKI